MPTKEDGELIPDARVAERYGVHSITVSRWDADDKLGFPAPVVINRRKYRRRSELETWERAHVAQRANRQSA
jgi:hypothetical protein